MILVFGGTTEGKRVISILNEMQLPFIYSTKMEINIELGEFGKYRHGALTTKGLVQFIQDEKIQEIIHVAHPFATELHHTIDGAIQTKNIEVLRLERIYSERVNHELVTYVDDYEELLIGLIQPFQGKKLLALTGVQSIEKLKMFWIKNTSYFRILDRASSIEIADKSDFPREQLILEKPENLIGREDGLVQELEIDVIVTKESGNTGALEDKIAIALKREIPIFIITKPELPKSFIQFDNIETLKDRIILNSSLKTVERWG